ncbi:MAG: beta-N-acetylhexosaminidase [Kiritimatiellales bacterium]
MKCKRLGKTEHEPLLIPLPVEMSIEEGTFQFTPETVILYNGQVCGQAARMLAEQFRPATGLPLRVCDGGRGLGPERQAVSFQLSADATPEGDGYKLCVTESYVQIAARSPAGLFYGMQTLRQLMPPEIFSAVQVPGVWEIPCVSIYDFPRFGWRGMHLDVSRHFLAKKDVLRFIDTIASLKFNRFHWHLTDDQGWRIEIKKYPKLTETGAWRKETLIGHLRGSPAFTYDGIPHGGFYTQDEIREIVKYADDRCITIVPEIDMPGHMQAAIAAYPELGMSSDGVEVMCKWGVSPEVLNPEETTVQFCKNILTEVLDLFPCEFIHIGGDEVDKTAWENSVRVQQLRRERGLTDMDEMQRWFIQQIEEFLSGRGRQLIGWDEILEGGLTGGAMVMPWRGGEKETAAIKSGHPVVMTPGKCLYFDHYQAQPVESEPLANSGFTPLKKVYEYDPVPAGLLAEEQLRILGAQGQLWTEYMPTMKQVEYMAFPRTCALAEAVWVPERLKNYNDFVRRLPAELKRLEEAGIHYKSLAEGGS